MMLYLEDYLEVIENIPQEIRDRTTDLRELDLGVNNASDQLEDEVKSFFGNATKMKIQDRENMYKKIKQEYDKLLCDADEKVSIASNMHDMLIKYMKKLDQELNKFKLELEADSPGVTDILEKRSLETEPSNKENQKESRYLMSNSNFTSHNPDWKSLSSSLKKEELLEPQLSSFSVSPPSGISYTLGHIGAGGTAIAAAASQAIAATQQMNQGRRSASMKASYDAINSISGIHPTELSIGTELATAAQTAIAASSLPQESNSNSSSSSATGSTNRRQKKRHGGSSSTTSTASVMMESSPAPSEELLQDSFIDQNCDNQDWTYDSNEPRYCVCNQVSYGDMVACDNPKCRIEWFHYPCVNITAPPKGKWYCPQCSTSMSRRQRR